MKSFLLILSTVLIVSGIVKIGLALIQKRRH